MHNAGHKPTPIASPGRVPTPASACWQSHPFGGSADRAMKHGSPALPPVGRSCRNHCRKGVLGGSAQGHAARAQHLLALPLGDATPHRLVGRSPASVLPAHAGEMPSAIPSPAIAPHTADHAGKVAYGGSAQGAQTEAFGTSRGGMRAHFLAHELCARGMRPESGKPASLTRAATGTA